MFHVVLLILKIIGMTLLVLLGLVLALVLLLLFVPLRYRIDGACEEAPEGMTSEGMASEGVALQGKTAAGKAAVSWLFSLVSVTAVYDGAATVSLRLAGIPVWKRKVWPAEEDEAEAAASGSKADAAAAPEKKAADTAAAPEKLAAAPGTQGDGGSAAADKKTDQQTRQETAADRKAEAGAAAPESSPVRIAELSFSGEPEDAEDVEDAEETEPVHKPSLFTRISEKLRGLLAGFRKKLERIMLRAMELGGRLTGQAEKLRKKLKDLKAAWEKAAAMLRNEENQKTARLLLRQLKKLIKHLLPRKIRGRIRFGFDDPYQTGQVLAAVSLFYGLYAKSLILEPVFDEQALEGELHVKGRIRAASILWIGLRVFFNRNFRKLLASLKKTNQGKK